MSAQTTTNAASSELVPLSDRLRYLQVFRVAVVAALWATVALLPEAVTVEKLHLAAATGLYVLLAAATHVASRLSSGRLGVLAFGSMLMADAIFLAWTSYGTGGFASPIRYLVLLHLIAVALLASFRTGLKLALWHSLLLMVVHYAQEAKILEPLAAQGIGTPFQQLIVFSGVCFASAMFTASFSAINERELRRRRFDLEALSRMATRLESTDGPREIADVVVDAVTDTFDFGRAVLFAQREGKAMTLAGGRGATEEIEPTPPGEGSVVREAMAVRRTLLVSHLDAEADAWLAALLPRARNVVVVPLSAEGQAIGALVIEQPKGGAARIHRRVISMVERFASHGALTLANAWLLDDARRRAATDGLTGLANRRTFDATLRQELERAARQQQDVSLVLADIDHFKRLNDTYGHQTGDDVLRRVAAQLGDGCRTYDTAARYGGEEFALVLPGTATEDAVVIADRLRQTIAAVLDEPRVTISAGVATFPAAATDPHGLIEAADQALYASKEGGRDRVTAAAPAHA
jgi:two-component system, cell cycle response regulator